ncbi:ABC transporter B family member 26, chloroplastic [Glycine soja]|nr:ABC transporter B family member 26, chloroplastic [Glycine soja]
MDGVLRSVRSDSATRSVIVIAHRLSTIQAADRIAVMDGGQIVEVDKTRIKLPSLNLRVE